MVARAVEQDELLRILHRQQAQQHLVDESEDGSIRADAERDRHERDDREERRACQPAPRVLQVSKKMSHTWSAARRRATAARLLRDSAFSGLFLLGRVAIRSRGTLKSV
ncbi:MAG: hypothetical protein AUH43_09380 [Acidobacteria bacterium 13_1_40CM_65_14]|nr:MAG: hypothetical protein AUH43_09380 [Acidobacteria bacterium 13_1_40CM_65_14]